MKKTLITTFLILAPALCAAPSNGQDRSPGASEPVVRELAGIQRALEGSAPTSFERSACA